MKPLYLDAAHIRNAIWALMEDHPVLRDDEELRADTLEGEIGLNDFMGRVLRRMQDRVIFVKGVDEVMEDYTVRRERATREIEAHRALLLQLMIVADLSKIEMPEATVSTRRIPPKLVIDDEAAIPADMLKTKTTTSPDKDAIKAVLEAGAPVPGAHLSNGDVGLTVRVR